MPYWPAPNFGSWSSPGLAAGVELLHRPGEVRLRILAPGVVLVDHVEGLDLDVARLQVARQRHVVHRRVRGGAEHVLRTCRPRRCAACRSRRGRGTSSSPRRPAPPRGSRPSRRSRPPRRRSRARTGCAAPAPAWSRRRSRRRRPARSSCRRSRSCCTAPARLPLLNASIITLAPLTAGMPKLSAAWPDRKLTMPSLKVSCACAPLATSSAAAARNRVAWVGPVMSCLLGCACVRLWRLVRLVALTKRAIYVRLARAGIALTRGGDSF